MSVSEDRKYTGVFVYKLLESVKGRTLGEVDTSRQFARAEKSPKITGIAGDVIEQSVFGYGRDSKQECDIEIDGVLTELKTTGVRIPKCDLPKVKGKSGDDYNAYLRAKEGISITAVTLEPTIQTDFLTSHFWEKARRLLIVFYEYKSYEVVPASRYADFPIVDYCYNSFSEDEKRQLKNDWEIVRNHLTSVYNQNENTADRYEHLVGFTHELRPKLLLIELVPGFKKKPSGSYQSPRYRLKQTFVDYIVQGHFKKNRLDSEVRLKEPFIGFEQLDARCHFLRAKYGGKTLAELKASLEIDAPYSMKHFKELCILKMFGADGDNPDDISDFTKAGIIAKTIALTPKGCRTEDMKLVHVDFEEWADRDVEFNESFAYTYFCEHSFLCPVFCEYDKDDASKTTFEGFKRFAFDDLFIEEEVRRTWEDSRNLIHRNELKWEYVYDKEGNICRNSSGSSKGAPNFPKSSRYVVFFRGSGTDSKERSRTEVVNGIRMLPQYIWLKGSFIADKLQSISYL